eukprot:3959155-Pyramimonas_sp.AAC.1
MLPRAPQGACTFDACNASWSSWVGAGRRGLDAMLGGSRVCQRGGLRCLANPAAKQKSSDV